MTFQNLTGIEYLQADIACKHDKAYEKETWDKRIAHFHELNLHDKNTYKEASNPIGLRAAALAYEDTLKGEPSGYMISLDACSSGLQILSLLVSCPKSFSLCGGVNDQCVDSYTTIYDAMHLHGALTRKQVKNAIMTSFYGSTSIPEDTFGTNVDVFYKTIMSMAPGAWDLNIGLQELWDDVRGHDYEWTLPDNFHAYVETSDKEKVKFSFLNHKYTLTREVAGRPQFHKGLGPNLIHSVDALVVREMFRRCMFSWDTVGYLISHLDSTQARMETRDDEMVLKLWEHYENTGFLSARILDHLREENMGLVDKDVVSELITSLPFKPFALVSNHDCFRCHPNYGNDLRRQYNRIMADINDSTLLKSLASQVVRKPVITKKVGTISRETILDANYMIC